jgi:hypothetical protein
MVERKKETISYRRKYFPEETQYKIARGEKLNSNEVNTLWDLTNHGGNSLKLESLRYYSAIFLIGEKDIVGAAEQLNKIPFRSKNNIIEIKAHELYKTIESQIPAEKIEDDFEDEVE